MPPHCDTMDGPVVTAAKKALETGNVNLIAAIICMAFTIDLKGGDKIGPTTLKSGTTLNIVLRTASGEDILTSVTLP